MLPVAVRRQRSLSEPFSPLERALDRFLGGWPSEAEADLTGAYPVDIREEDGKLVVDAEMPGFKRDEIDVSIDNGVLTITGERKPAETQGAKHLTERRYTRVDRSFNLPVPVDSDNVDASLDEGVLHLELPQTEESKPRRIEVK